MTSLQLMTEGDLSEVLGVPVKTLQRWRSTREHGPRYVKVGGGVRYRTADVDAWLDANTRGGGR